MSVNALDHPELFASQVFDAIYKDLKGRSGFGALLDTCTPEVRREIREVWRAIIIGQLERGEALR